MADLLAGLSLVEGISRLVPALLVLLLLFGVLEVTKAVSKNITINVLIALCAAVLVMVSPQATSMLTFMTPWFVILFFFIIFMLIAYKSMGVTDSQILSVLGKNSFIVWIIAFLGIGIAAVALGNSFGQDLLDSRSGGTYVKNVDGTFTAPDGAIVTQAPEGANFQSNLATTIFHPKILGFATLGLIATFSVFFMTKST